MKPQNLHDELKIREKIQGYKTPVQDSDWQKMLALLENDTSNGGKPQPETSTPAPGPAPTTRKRKYWLLFLLALITIGGWATVAGVWPDVFSTGANSGAIAVTRPNADDAIVVHPNPSDDAVNNNHVAANHPATGGNSSSENSALHFPDPTTQKREITANTTVPNNTAAPKIPARTNPQGSSRSVNGQVNQPPYPSGGTGGSIGEKTASTGSTSPSSSAVTLSSENAAPTGQTSSSSAATLSSANAASTGQTSPSVLAAAGDENAISPTPEVPFWQNLAVLYPLPHAKTELTLPPLRPDTLIRPATQLPRKPRRFQRGLVLGGNLNMVDYATGRLSIMPQLGYHWSTPVRDGYRFQAEIQLKYVTHYEQRTQFFYVAPGASLDIRWEMDNLFFIEMPLLIKQENREIGKIAWLAGLKPAWCTPIFPYGSNTSNVGMGGGLGPRVDLRLRDGVRAFDLGLVLGWEWRFTPRWSLDMRYNQGFLDLTHDNFFKNTTTHLNSDVQVTLRHYIHPYKRNRHAKHTLFPEPRRDH
jgi:hypothetical protein